MLSVVVVALNERENLRNLLEESISLKSDFENKELIIVNNNSSDGSYELLNEYAGKYNFVKILHLPKNYNFGGGIKEGLKISVGEDLAFIPGDYQVRLVDLLSIYKIFQNERYDVVKGYRVNRDATITEKLVSKFYFTLTYLFLRNKRVKEVSVMPKFFKRKYLPSILQIPLDDFGFDVGFVKVVSDLNLSVLEVPIEYNKRSHGTSSWSGKRFATYWKAIKNIFVIRKIKFN